MGSAEKPLHVARVVDTGAAPVSPDSGVPADDTAGGTESGAPRDSGDDPDSGDTGSHIPLVPIEVAQGEAIVCADPDARASAPLRLPDLGTDWTVQHFTGESTSPIAAGGLTIADLNGDGFQDVFIPHIGMDQLFMGQPDATLTDESTERLPEGGVLSATSASVVDVEGDGDLDLFIASATDQNRLWLNDGSGVFTDGTDAAGLGGQGWPGVASLWGDMDGDDDLDLFVVTFRTCDPAIATDPDNPWADTPQALWENQGDGTFVDVTERIPEHPGGEGRFRAGAWIDLDGDRDLDLHLVSDKGFSSTCMLPNVAYRNDGAAFTEASTDMALNITMEGMGHGIGDMNSDGTPDFVMSDMRRIWLVESDSIGGWYDTTAVRDLRYDPDARNRWSAWGTELADLDNDGDLDLYVSFGGLLDAPIADMNPIAQPDALFVQSEDGTFDEVSSEWGVDDMASNRAVLTVDINGDGWLDLARRTIDGEATIAFAQCGANSWIMVDLVQSGANPRAVGATVTVVAGGVSQVRWLTIGATGLQSSGGVSAHFGLGEADLVESVEVRWPDGTASRVTDLGVNRTITITRSDDE